MMTIVAAAGTLTLTREADFGEVHFAARRRLKAGRPLVALVIF